MRIIVVTVVAVLQILLCALPAGAVVDVAAIESGKAKNLELASDNLQSGNYRNAINYANRVLAVESKNVTALYCRGVAEYYCGEYPAAEQDLDAVLRADEQNNDALFYRARVRCLSGKEGLALVDFDNLIRGNPDNALYYACRAEVNNRLHYTSAAAADSERALQLNPDLPEAWFQRGNARYAHGEYDMACQDYQQTLKLAPRFSGAQHNLKVAEDAIAAQRQSETDNRKAQNKKQRLQEAIALEMRPQPLGEIHSAAYGEIALGLLYPAGIRVGLVQKTFAPDPLYFGARVTVGGYSTYIYDLVFGAKESDRQSTDNKKESTDISLFATSFEGLCGVRAGDFDIYVAAGVGRMWVYQTTGDNIHGMCSFSGTQTVYPVTFGGLYRSYKEGNEMPWEFGVEVSKWAGGILALNGWYELSLNGRVKLW